MLRLAVAIGLLIFGIPNASADHWWMESYGPPPSAWESKGGPPQPKSISASSDAAVKDRDTDRSPIPVKLLNTGKTTEETANDAKYQADQATTNRWIICLTGALGVFTLLVAVAGLVQIRISADTARKQLRAYVSLERWKIELLQSGIVSDHKIADENGIVIFGDFLCATVKNFGLTPAANVTFVGYVTSLTFGLRPDISVFSSQNDAQRIIESKGFTSQFTLAPGQSETTKMPIIDKHALQAIKDARRKKAAIFVWGHFYYRDIYNRPWRTKVCHAWEPWHPHGERFVPYEHHNGEDSESLEEQAGK